MRRVRYAVVGQGYIAQIAVLPAFAHARKNSELAALVSGDRAVRAARSVFAAEPMEVLARSANNGERRFREVDEMTTAVMRFPGERLATFTCSLGAADVSAYQVVGTSGTLRVDPAYGYAEALVHHLQIGEKEQERRFRKRDQFAAELLHFSDCIRRDREPEPSGTEGLADVRIIRALLRSARTGRPVRLGPFICARRPRLTQGIERPPVRKPRLVRADSPSPE